MTFFARYAQRGSPRLQGFSSTSERSPPCELQRGSVCIRCRREPLQWSSNVGEFAGIGI